MTDDRGAAALAERLCRHRDPVMPDEWQVHVDDECRGLARAVLGEHGRFLPDGQSVDAVVLACTGCEALEAEVERACWTWRGSKTNEGYGTLAVAGRTVYAHRLSYETFVGPIPPDKQIDHLCRNRACVRPDHMEVVTRKENILRGESPTAKNARKMTCPRGHPLTPLANGYRHCQVCKTERTRASRAAGYMAPSDLTRQERKRTALSLEPER